MKIGQIALAVAATLAASTAFARDGDYVKSFGVDGREQIGFAPGLNTSLGFVDFVSLAVQTDGKLVVAATVDNQAAPSPSTDFGVLRLNSNGTLDTNYGTQGQVIVPFDLGGNNNDVVSSLLLQPNGRSVVCGEAGGSQTGGGSDMGLARLTTSGVPDTQFSGDGKTTVPFDIGPAGSRDDIAVRCALQSDGKIVAAGRAAIDANTQRMAVARLNADGSRDLTFNGSGKVTIDFGASYPTALAFDVTVQPDGKLLLTGAVSGADNVLHWVFARLDAEGQLDTAFGNGGTLVFDPDVPSYQPYEGVDAIALADGSIVAVGVMALAPGLSNGDYGIFKLTANGSLDPSFGTNGGLVIPFDLGGGFLDAAVKVLVDGQGRFLLGGFSSTDTSYTDSVARVSANGVLDASFGVGGKISVSSTVPPATDYGEQGTDIALAPDGSIYVGSVANFDASNHYHIGLVKLIGDTIFSDGFEE